jgi:hypothetical protein
MPQTISTQDTAIPNTLIPCAPPARGSVLRWQCIMKMTRLTVPMLLLSAALLPAQTRKLDTTSFVVLGEGLAAGFHDFSLSKDFQQYSFPAQMASQMATLLVQPNVQSPGIGSPAGFPPQPVSVTRTLQTTVRSTPPDLFVQNLSVPGLHLADAIGRRPVSPLLHRADTLQTSINLILGFPALLLEVEGKKVPVWSQLEYAQKLSPTLAVVELGFVEAMEAAILGDAAVLPSRSAFGADLSKVVSALRSVHAEVVVMTVPDPFDTAYFTTVLKAAPLLRTQPWVITGLYDLQLNDFLTIPGINEIAFQFLDLQVDALSPGHAIPAASAELIRKALQAINSEVIAVAQQQSAVVFDLAGFFARVKSQGVVVGGTKLDGSYLGGFYSMNGQHPGPTGHALIANEVLAQLNKTYGTSFAAVDAAKLLAIDQTAQLSANLSGPEIGLEELLPSLSEENRLRVLERVARWFAEAPRPAKIVGRGQPTQEGSR